MDRLILNVNFIKLTYQKLYKFVQQQTNSQYMSISSGKSIRQHFAPIISLCPLQQPKFTYNFRIKQQQQIKRLVNSAACLQSLLKHIHHKFYDQGLLYTLVHKVYQCNNQDIQFYVPELVYMAIKKNCKPIKKLLIYKASHNQALRRLILWNVKAFTVLMKQKDLEIKRIIQEFQQVLIDQEKNIIVTVKSQSKFSNSQKAISMLTTASLQLKKMQPSTLKQKLNKFIKRFNIQFLNNLHHSIIIPFRKDQSQTFNSKYVCHIVEDDCSCFPTRKRVPYRIIIQTIDINQLANHQPNQKFFKTNKVQPDQDRDLYQEVYDIVEQMYGQAKYKSIMVNHDNKYPFAVDQEESLKINQLSKFARQIEKQQKQLQNDKDTNVVTSKIKKTFLKRRNTISKDGSDGFHLGFSKSGSRQQFKFQETQKLKKFQATYIPTLPSNMRKSESNIHSHQNLFVPNLQDSRYRWSGQKSIHKPDSQNIKVIQQQTRWNAAYEDSAWGLPWNVKERKYKAISHFKHFESFKLHNVVVKGGDDLRQEIVCMQLIFKMNQLIKKAKIDIYIKPYQIIVLSQNSGLLEFVSNSISVDGMKKQKEGVTMSQFFSQAFETQQKLLVAKENFIRSLVGSSILTYVLKLKDRHNGNILLDNQGHIIHIDFGFILGMSPGGVNFQTSPFKMTQQYVDFMGGKNSPDYQFFQQLFCQGMRVLRQKMDQICLVLEIMMENSDLQCFQNFKIEMFKQRFKPQLSLQKYKVHCLNLIQKSCMNSRTVHYDFFQYYTNGISP